MKKVENKIKTWKGHGIADMDKYELDLYIKNICDLFMANGAIEWEGEPIFTKTLLFEHIQKFNKDRINNGWTFLTPKDMKNIKEKLFEPYSIVPTNQIEMLEKAIKTTYDKMSENIATLQIQLDELKKHTIVLEECYSKEITKKEVK